MTGIVGLCPTSTSKWMMLTADHTGKLQLESTSVADLNTSIHEDTSIDSIINPQVVIQHLQELGYNPSSLSNAALEEFVGELKAMYQQGMFDNKEQHEGLMSSYQDNPAELNQPEDYYGEECAQKLQLSKSVIQSTSDSGHSHRIIKNTFRPSTTANLNPSKPDSIRYEPRFDSQKHQPDSSFRLATKKPQSVTTQLEHRLAGLDLTGVRSTVIKQVETARVDRRSRQFTHQSNSSSELSSPISTHSATSPRHIHTKYTEDIRVDQPSMLSADRSNLDESFSQDELYIGDEHSCTTTTKASSVANSQGTHTRKPQSGFIRTWQPRRSIQKHDPVARYHQHQEQWSQDKFLKRCNATNTGGTHCAGSEGGSRGILSQNRWGGMRDPPVSSQPKP
ncbi:hypothetical protein BDEG_27279 [Batrachochytrium dendrobatidis JEL423]|uniref:Uncharacterized protein n=1 Tax=Batrachochytrium dendrobatidis (strain JEL423) TaxID=403673 RepID=A0A177WVA3_BATDL|nr:hypothetical protein BDEG_27279 [Batrachochytrium dendrobatidis JEL423]